MASIGLKQVLLSWLERTCRRTTPHTTSLIYPSLAQQCVYRQVTWIFNWRGSKWFVYCRGLHCIRHVVPWVKLDSAGCLEGWACNTQVVLVLSGGSGCHDWHLDVVWTILPSRSRSDHTVRYCIPPFTSSSSKYISLISSFQTLDWACFRGSLLFPCVPGIVDFVKGQRPMC